MGEAAFPREKSQVVTDSPRSISSVGTVAANHRYLSRPETTGLSVRLPPGAKVTNSQELVLQK